MTQPMQQTETVFPRWVTLLVMFAWIGVMAWAISFSTIALY